MAVGVVVAVVFWSWSLRGRGLDRGRGDLKSIPGRFFSPEARGEEKL